MSSQTERQSPAPIKPSSGAKPPFASSSKSEAWRALRVSARAVSGLPINAALAPVGSGPAAGTFAFALTGLRGAGHAPDRRVALVVKWVVRHVMLLDVVPDSLVVPVRERVQLPEPEPLVPAELGCRRPGL